MQVKKCAHNKTVRLNAKISKSFSCFADPVNLIYFFNINPVPVMCIILLSLLSLVCIFNSY